MICMLSSDFKFLIASRSPRVILLSGVLQDFNILIVSDCISALSCESVPRILQADSVMVTNSATGNLVADTAKFKPRDKMFLSSSVSSRSEILTTHFCFLSSTNFFSSSVIVSLSLCDFSFSLANLFMCLSLQCACSDSCALWVKVCTSAYTSAGRMDFNFSRKSVHFLSKRRIVKLICPILSLIKAFSAFSKICFALSPFTVDFKRKLVGVREVCLHCSDSRRWFLNRANFRAFLSKSLVWWRQNLPKSYFIRWFVVLFNSIH